jgi:hypothetical protein
MRSRLLPHKDAIAEALDAGTSTTNLARTYGCARQTMEDFIGRHLPDRANASHRHQATRPTRNKPFKKCQYDTLRRSALAVDRSRQRAEESYL